MSRASTSVPTSTRSDQRLVELVDGFMAGAPHLASELLAELAQRSSGAGPAISTLIDAMRSTDGGKYVRPRLVAAAYFGLGGGDPVVLRRVAGAQQLLHLGLCLHDDVIDGDRMRHGRSNVIGLVEQSMRSAGLDGGAAVRQGEAAGILAGDLALNAAVLALLSVPASGDTQIRLVRAALEAVERTIHGELLDVRSETLAPARSEPLRVAALKTASYSVALPLTLGAIAAGSTDPSLLSALEQVGAAFGVAYQLCDDDLGLFGSTAVTGKSTLSDLRDGKRTEHIRVAHERAGDLDRAVIDDVLGRSTADDVDARRVREIVTATGARRAVHELIDAHLELGSRVAEEALPRPLAEHLIDLARALRGRAR